MGPSILAALLSAACMLADTSAEEPAAARRAFSVDVSFKPLPPASNEQDGLQQSSGLQRSQQPAPVTSIGAGQPWAWKPEAPVLPESKGPPPFMPDAEGSVEVHANAPIATTVTTTVAPPEGILGAAMPLVSGVQKMVGQVEKGAKQMLHLPSDDKDSSSGKPAAPKVSNDAATMKAKTTKAEWRLKIAHKQAAELQAQLAKVKAQLKKTSEPVTQSPTQATPTGEKMTKTATSIAKLNKLAVELPAATPGKNQWKLYTKGGVEWDAGKYVTQHAGGAPVSDFPVTVVLEPVKAEDTVSKPTEATMAPATAAPATAAPATAAPATTAPTTEAPATKAPPAKAQTTEASAAEAPATKKPATKAKSTETSSKPAEPKSKPASPEPVAAAHKKSAGDGSKSKLSDLAAALRGSQKDKSTRLYKAPPAINTSGIFILSSQGNMLAVGSVAVSVAAVMALAARFLRAPGHGPAAIEESHDSEDSAVE